MRKYSIENIIFIKSENPNFLYDVCVVDCASGVYFVTNIRNKNCFLKTEAVDNARISPDRILNELDVSSISDLYVHGFYRYMFSDREHKLSLKYIKKLQKFIDDHQLTLEKQF